MIWRLRNRVRNGGATGTVITGTGGGLTSVMKVFLAASEGETDRETVVSHKELGRIHYSASALLRVTMTNPNGRIRQSDIM